MSSAEFPASILIPADPSNYGVASRKPVDVDHIVIHCTDGRGIAMRVAEMWQEAHHGSSAHFVIGQDGVIIQSVLTKDIAYHAHAANRRGIGIEHCARTPGELKPDDPGLPPSQVQLAASARLVAWLCVRCGLAPTRDVIVGHAEIDEVTTHRRCPTGCGWDWDSYIAQVQSEYESLQSGAAQ
jgi:N-acetyl-anhydromuramyl-L-alanine amidase AmpD